MNAYSWLWMLVIGQAVALEIFTLCNKTARDTLSEQIQALYSIPSFGPFVAWMLTAFLVWLPVHFIVMWIWPNAFGRGSP